MTPAERAAAEKASAALYREIQYRQVRGHGRSCPAFMRPLENDACTCGAREGYERLRDARAALADVGVEAWEEM